MHQDLKYLACCFCNRGAGTEYCCNAGIIQEFIIVRRYDSPGNHKDILPAKFPEFPDYLRDKCFMSCSKT